MQDYVIAAFVQKKQGVAGGGWWGGAASRPRGRVLVGEGGVREEDATSRDPRAEGGALEQVVGVL